MLMLEQASSHKSAPHLQVFATDSSDDMLQLARAGAYPEEVAASITPARLERFFSEYSGYFRIKSEVRDIVVFAPHDVFKDPPFAHLDLIVCPSVLGDLQPEVRRGVLRLFHFALERDGALIVGPNDEIDEPGLFEADGRTTRVFRRRDGPRRPLVMPLSARAIRAAANGEPAAAAGALWESSFVLAHRRALEKHIVPSVLVDAENRVVHYSPRAWQFLRIPGGELNHDILALVGTSLRAPLQRGLAEARRVDLPWVSPPLAIMTDHGPRRVLLRVEPAGRVDHTQLLLVMFDELAADANAAAADAADPDANAEEALKKELHSAASVDRLATALERTNLRLRAIVDAVTVPSIQESHSAERDNGKLRAILGELESNQEELRALNQDITAVDLARRQRIDELAQQSSDSYQLLQATGIATLFLDTELRVLRFTPRATEIFRVSEADVGRPLVELTHTLATTELIPDAERVLEHLTAVEREVRADGDRWYLLRMLPYRPVPAYVSGVAVTLVDITDRVRAEEVLRQADRRKDEFLALLAHELRNPLAPISSGVELLRIAAPDHEIIRKVIPMMRRQVRQLVRMVDDLLEASRISGGRLRLRKGPTLLSDVVRDAVSATTLLIDQAKQRLTVDVPDEPVLLDADAARLTQVLSNLLSNASRYTPSGGHITVDARREGTEAVIRVTDTGVGMSKDVMQNMFGMFYRGANARRAGDSGLGIGLAIAKELVEMHGGMLTASSAGPGRGSQFMIQLPVSTDATAIVPAKEADILPSHGLRVLIVDDNPDAAEALSLQVEAMGAHQVVTVLGGEDALSRGREFRPDVVLLDLGMPEMDGFEVARRIRQEAWGKHVTLVALTGWGQEEHRQRTKAAGFNRHLTKPADRADIESVLAQSEPQ
jgi:two-component system CheB/CheR fusion protein